MAIFEQLKSASVFLNTKSKNEWKKYVNYKNNDVKMYIFVKKKNMMFNDFYYLTSIATTFLFFYFSDLLKTKVYFSHDNFFRT